MPTQATDTTSVINFGNNTWIIAPGVIASDLGASASQPNSILVNYGSILTQFHGSVFFGGGASGRLYNQLDGLIVGNSGVDVTGDLGVSIRNRGDIFGDIEHGIHVRSAGNNVAITNSGEILGILGGVTVSAGSATNVQINNSGVIASDQHGIWLLNATGAAPVIVNSGTISGATNAIFAQDGDRLDVTNSGQIIGHIRATSANQIDEVVNNGTVSGNVLLGSGNDIYRGTGTVSGSVSGQEGNDTLSGGSGVERLLGGDDNDTLTGNAGNDVLDGGLGTDILMGNAGKDTATGGGGNDTFRYLLRTDSAVGSLADVIMDFDDSGNDRIDLAAVFGGTMTYRHDLAFTASGQVRINDISGADVIVEVNTGGSLAADMSIRLGATTLASMIAGDFLL